MLFYSLPSVLNKTPISFTLILSPVYGVQRIEEGRLPKEVMKWCPPGRRKRGRPKLTCAEWIRGLMGEKGLVEEEWNDRGSWRKKML